MGTYKEMKFIDEMIYETEINTLKVFYIPKKGFTRSYAILTSDFGSKDVEFSIDGGDTYKRYPEGIAHFLEHKVFEMPGGENIFNKFTELGASVNAFTNNSQTSYYFSTTDNFSENLELLLKMVTTPYLTEENVEKEKGIIAEEIKMYEDHPGFRGYIEALKSLYYAHPVREDIAGTVESIYKLTPRDLLDCYEAFYNPRNLILVLVGDLEVASFEEIIRKNVKPGEAIDLVKRAYEEPRSSLKKTSEIDMSLQVPNYIYAFKVPGEDANLLKESLTGSVMMKLIFGSTSSFYETNLNNGNINDSFSTEISLETDHGEIFIGGESKEPMKTMAIIDDYIEVVKKDKDFFIDRKIDMERIKKAMIGSYTNIFNSVDGIGTFTTGMLLHKEDIFNYVDILKNITVEDLEVRFERLFDKDSSTKVVIK
ncbi:MAG: pitrilysin family protein [Clostridiaceae bacterium]